jgi:tetratricopeptide (TPR) repeat protein
MSASSGSRRVSRGIVARERAGDGQRGQLLGRARERGDIERVLGEVEPGRPLVLQISGASGIGKTSLLSYIDGQVDETSYLTLKGRAAEFGTDQPFDAFADAFEPVLAELDADAAIGLEDEQMAELARVFPALTARAGMSHDGPERHHGAVGVERYRLHRAVSALLDVLARGRRVLLTLDDLHWADPASVELLLYLLRRPPKAPLLVVVAFRTNELRSQIAAILQQVQRGSQGHFMELAPLSANEANALLPPGLPRELAERVYRDSAGNPFYLKELVRAIRRDDDGTVVAPGGGGRVPPTITAVITHEIDRLSAAGRELLRVAAVLGDPFEPELAGEIAKMDQVATLVTLDELVERDLVQPASVPGCFSFRHPIVRRAVYESAKGGWRLGAHSRAAAVLATRGASAAVRAPHVERSAKLGDLEAIDVLAEAGYASAPRAPAAGADWFHAALRLLPSGQDPTRRLELTIAMAVSLGSAGRLEESCDAFQEVLSWLSLDNPLRGQVAAVAALIEHLLGKHDEARGLLLSTLAGLDDRSLAATEIKLEIATGCFFRADWDEMGNWAVSALEGDEASPVLRAGALAGQALAAFGNCDVGAAGALASKAATLADPLSDADWATRLSAIGFLGWAEYCAGRFVEADRHMERALAVSRITGQQHLSAAMLVVQAMSNLALGRLSLASELADTAIDTSLLSANYLFLTWAQTMRCMVEIECGSPASAVRIGQEALDASTRSRSPWSSVATLYLAEAWLESDEPEHARRELLAGAGAPRLPPLPFYAVHAYELLTRCELELGRPAAATGWAEQAVQLAGRLGLDGQWAEARRAQAMLLMDAGSFAAAAEMALASADDAERAAQPIQAARSHAELRLARRIEDCDVIVLLTFTSSQRVRT